jgi:hypothetical protein
VGCSSEKTRIGASDNHIGGQSRGPIVNSEE